ncbi:hypothetical protein EG329_000011 [Mollisiaceae sp. DMI_Dod_QoI]|nr:hypothetical protein EG329_000011 [Helotiales sp. DMI_Dod_QoI]
MMRLNRLYPSGVLDQLLFQAIIILSNEENHPATIRLYLRGQTPIRPMLHLAISDMRIHDGLGDHAKLNLSTVRLPFPVEDGPADNDKEEESSLPWIQLGSTATLALLCGLVTDNQQARNTSKHDASKQQMDDNDDSTSNIQDANTTDSYDIECRSMLSEMKHGLTVHKVRKFERPDTDARQQLRAKRKQVHDNWCEVLDRKLECSRVRLEIATKMNDIDSMDEISRLESMLYSMEGKFHQFHNSHDKLEAELRVLEDRVYGALGLAGCGGLDSDDSVWDGQLPDTPQQWQHSYYNLPSFPSQYQTFTSPMTQFHQPLYHLLQQVNQQPSHLPHPPLGSIDVSIVPRLSIVRVC